MDVNDRPIVARVVATAIIQQYRSQVPWLLAPRIKAAVNRALSLLIGEPPRRGRGVKTSAYVLSFQEPGGDDLAQGEGAPVGSEALLG